MLGRIAVPAAPVVYSPVAAPDKISRTSARLAPLGSWTPIRTDVVLGGVVVTGLRAAGAAGRAGGWLVCAAGEVHAMATATAAISTLVITLLPCRRGKPRT